MRTAERGMELELTTVRQDDTLRRVAANGASAVKTFVQRIYNRVLANRMMELDDYLLADIGLARSDLFDALNAGPLEDPTAHLTRAARRRSATRFKTL